MDVGPESVEQVIVQLVMFDSSTASSDSRQSNWPVLVVGPHLCPPVSLMSASNCKAGDDGIHWGMLLSPVCHSRPLGEVVTSAVLSSL